MANDIFEVLAEDHRRVEGLIEALENTTDQVECMNLLSDLSLEIVAHMRGEERILYPRIKQDERGRELEDDAEEQHAMAEELLGELVAMGGMGDGYTEKLRQLKSAIEEHVLMEEDEIFTLGREIFSESQRAELAAELEDVKLEVQGSIEQVAAGAAFQPGAEGSAAPPP